MLAGRAVEHELDIQCLLRLWYLLIGLTVQNVSKKTQRSITSGSMMVYMRGTNRRLTELGFKMNTYTDKISADSDKGLQAVLESHSAEQQAQRITRTSHNFLSIATQCRR